MAFLQLSKGALLYCGSVSLPKIDYVDITAAT